VFDATTLAKPQFVGVQTLEYPNLAELVPFIDWGPFFSTWELKGKYPEILQDPTVGPEATRLFADAQAMLQRIVQENWFRPKAVVGIFPANSLPDDCIAVYTDENRTQELLRLQTLRQQLQKAPGIPSYALSDFIAPYGSVPDFIGAFAVTAGPEADEIAKRYEADHDDYQAILVKALADRIAEAMAEHLHHRVRAEFWGYAPEEHLSIEQLVSESYRGIRPAPGYPAQPDHTEKGTLWQLLGVEERIGLSLTESYAMFPAASVSGLYFAHPEARYFGVGQIQPDQVQEYAERKNLEVAAMERWLAPLLAYDPAPRVLAV
jgi:5-methyltetrahydrofolate--homocysteine methyltransferase